VTTPYYPARDGHPSVFASEDKAGALSGEPIFRISGMSGSVDGANDNTAQDAPMRTTCREALTLVSPSGGPGFECDTGPHAPAAHRHAWQEQPAVTSPLTGTRTGCRC
jgi:hypothetical protein